MWEYTVYRGRFESVSRWDFLGWICRKIEGPKVEFCDLPTAGSWRGRQWRRLQSSGGGRRCLEGLVSLKRKQKRCWSRRELPIMGNNRECKEMKAEKGSCDTKRRSKSLGLHLKVCFINRVSSWCSQVTDKANFSLQISLTLQAFETIEKRKLASRQLGLWHSIIWDEPSHLQAWRPVRKTTWLRQREEESCRRWSQREHYEGGRGIREILA